jgi:2-oxoglutarate ferredoxin oxidoreductase subunit delta
VARKTGTVQIRAELCKGCDLCVAICPEHVLEMTDTMNEKGWPVVTLARDACTGCSLCAVACPDGVFVVYQEPDRDAARASATARADR